MNHPLRPGLVVLHSNQLEMLFELVLRVMQRPPGTMLTICPGRSTSAASMAFAVMESSRSHAPMCM